MESEKKYTLAEARNIINREACDMWGHALTENLDTQFDGTRINTAVWCSRCNAVFKEVTYG